MILYTIVSSQHARSVAHQRLMRQWSETSRWPAALPALQSDLACDQQELPGNADTSGLLSNLLDAQEEIEQQISWPARGDATPSEKTQEAAEGNACLHLYDALDDAGLPISALDDPGLWTWISMQFLWNFIVYREFKSVTKYFECLDQGADPSRLAFLDYIDGKKGECVARRMYLRIRCLGDSQFHHLAAEVPEGTDFWRSSILRRKQGEHPAIVQAVASRQSKRHGTPGGGRLATNPLRAFSRNLSFEARNLDLHSLTDAERQALVERLWMEQQGQ